MARAVRYKTKVAILLVNLDGFKKINKEHGSNAGGEVLRMTALRLRSAIRTTDSIIRLDGDEFMLVMPDMMLDVDVRRTAATLIAVARKPLTLAGNELQIHCSIGVAIYPNTGSTLQELLTGAEIAMCWAKAQGHNQYVIYNPSESRFRSDRGDGANSGLDGDTDVEVDEDAAAEQYAD